MRGVHVRLGEIGRIGRDQRQVGGIGKVDQAGLGGFLDGVAAPRQLDIEPAREQGAEALGHVAGAVRLSFGE